MNETKDLVKRIVEGIQEKKGKDIVVADLTGTDNTICKYFVICEGNTPTQVAAIADSVSDYVRIHAGEKPICVEGMRTARWVAMDYYMSSYPRSATSTIWRTCGPMLN